MTTIELQSIARELSPPFSVHRPTRAAAPVLFCSPHSGRIYPSVLTQASRLTPADLRKSEDCFVEELFGAAPAHGATLIEAHFPRAYLDVNREAYELDPELFREPLPEYANARTMRVIGGLGTIARIVAESEEIYAAPLPLSAAFARIDALYKPFHETLRCLLDAHRDQFGHTILIDCHSMPSGSSAPSADRPDVVIGDRFGSSCDQKLTRFIRQHLTQAGYRVQLNRPYAGGYITEHYGRPRVRQHAIQIEINRGLYMNEATFEPTSGFAPLKRDLTDLVRRIASEAVNLIAPPLAAE